MTASILRLIEVLEENDKITDDLICHLRERILKLETERNQLNPQLVWETIISLRSRIERLEIMSIC